MTKIRKPLAPPTRPHSERVRPDPPARCQQCGGSGVVMGYGHANSGPTIEDCPRCYPDTEESDEQD